MNIDEIMEMVMSNEDVKNLSYKESEPRGPLFFCPIKWMGKGVLKEKRNDLSAKVAPWCNSAICVLKWPVAHTTRRADRRQECRERGYYHLHRQLDDTLLLHTIFVFIRWCGGAGVSLSRGWRREITLLRNSLPLE